MFKVPKRLFHATKPIYVASILENGLIPSSLDGLVYLTSTKEGALSFAQFYRTEAIYDPAHEGINKEMNIYDYTYVIEISTKQLHSSLLKKGTDHHPMFFNNVNVLTYPTVIPTQAIVTVWEHHFPSGKTKNTSFMVLIPVQKASFIIKKNKDFGSFHGTFLRRKGRESYEKTRSIRDFRRNH